ncbi:MAG: glycosyltransferase family 39 protein [Magnetococcales bacterium]|nr:glycosyltransferase family 39 protein [Magnetococcales bacterium]MBF0321894.1 glycosyltransferase family 39 protein [Magnetococcales bacterium]
MSDEMRKNLLSLLFLSLLFFLYYAHVMNAPVTNDESFFAGASVCAVDYTLYKDFNYNHFPIYPLFFSQIFSHIDHSYLFIARIFTCVFATLAVFVFFKAAKLVGGTPSAAWVTSLLVATSTLHMSTFKTARNDPPAILLNLIGILATLTAINQVKNRSLLYFSGGLAFAMAIGMRVSFFYFPAIFLFYLVFESRQNSFRYDIKNIFLPFAAGGVSGLTPVLYYLIVTEDAFIRNTC